MSVYIDNMNAPYRGMIMCHLIADTQHELLEIVDKIGVQKKWIQYKDTPLEHFDISLAKKALALKAGAKEIGWREYATKVKEKCIAAGYESVLDFYSKHPEVRNPKASPTPHQ